MNDLYVNLTLNSTSLEINGALLVSSFERTTVQNLISLRCFSYCMHVEGPKKQERFGILVPRPLSIGAWLTHRNPILSYRAEYGHCGSYSMVAVGGPKGSLGTTSA